MSALDTTTLTQHMFTIMITRVHETETNNFCKLVAFKDKQWLKVEYKQ